VRPCLFLFLSGLRAAPWSRHFLPALLAACFSLVPCPCRAPSISSLTSGSSCLRNSAIFQKTTDISTRNICTQALLRAGSVYGVLDLLSQHKKGQGYFTHREIATLDMLKRELLFWEEVFARGWQHVVDKRTQHEQRLLEKKAERKRHSPVRRLGAERPDDPRTHERAEGGEQGAPDDANNALEDLEDEATDQEREKEQNQLSTGSSGSGDDPQEASAAGGGTSWSFVSTTRAAR